MLKKDFTKVESMQKLCVVLQHLGVKKRTEGCVTDAYLQPNATLVHWHQNLKFDAMIQTTGAALLSGKII